MAKRREKPIDPSAYPPGFVEWAVWYVDLSYNAPSWDEQYKALLPKWEAIQPNWARMPAAAHDGEGGE